MSYTLWGVPIPDWLGEWIEDLAAVPLVARLTLVWLGVMIGLTIAAGAVLAGMFIVYR